MRFVLDTSILVAAIRSPDGASRALLEAALCGDFEILISPALVLEYEAVLTRSEHLCVANLTAGEIDEILDALCRIGTRVNLQRRWRPQLHDPDGEMVLETAINGQADAIVTFNRADFAFAGKRFGLLVLTPAKALAKVEPL